MPQMYKVTEQEPNKDAPWEDDKLNIQEVADVFTPFVVAAKQPFVVSLNSPFGTGKTFLLKRWALDLNAKGINAVYFNAWETDYSNEPLVAFMACIKAWLEERVKADQSKLEKVTSSLKKMAASVFALIRKHSEQAGQIAGQVLALQGVDPNVSTAAGGAASAVSKELSNKAYELLAGEQAAQASLVEFRKQLTKIIKTISGDEGREAKLVVLVDELDRCRPNYAIEVLEIIKHFFSVPGSFFILAVDDDQLKSSLGAVYGPNVDADRYLRKLIDWRLDLRKPNAKNYATTLYDDYNFPEVVKTNVDDTFLFWAELLALSLRDVEQAFIEIQLLCSQFERNPDGPPNFPILAVPIVVAIKHGDRLLFNKFFRDKKISAMALISEIDEKAARNVDQSEWASERIFFFENLFDQSIDPDELDQESRESFLSWQKRGALPVVSLVRQTYNHLVAIQEVFKSATIGA